MYSYPCFISNANTDIVQHAVSALRAITDWPIGVQAGLDADMLDYLPTLLDSSDIQIRADAGWILEHLP